MWFGCAREAGEQLGDIIMALCSVCACACPCMCMCVCMRVHVHVCMYACVCMCVCTDPSAFQLVNGRRPIGAEGRRIPEPELRFVLHGECASVSE